MDDLDDDEQDVEDEQIAEGDSGDSNADDDDMEIPIRGRAERGTRLAYMDSEVGGSEDEDGGQDNGHDDGEDVNVDEEEAASQPVRGKRKQQPSAAARRTAQVSTKRAKRANDIASLPLAEQEALALRSLQSRS